MKFTIIMMSYDTAQAFREAIEKAKSLYQEANDYYNPYQLEIVHTGTTMNWKYEYGSSWIFSFEAKAN